MQADFKISPIEGEALAPILASFSARAKYQITLEKLLGVWYTLVTEVESGYNDSIYEYKNDLSTRDLLQDILLRVPQALVDRLTNVLQPWDDRFKAATRIIRVALTVGETKELGFWWFRIPKMLGGELERDLRSTGILH